MLWDGRVMTIGGEDEDGVLLATAEVYDPATGAVTTIGAHDVVARREPTVALLPDRRVLVAGGITEDGVTDIVSLYDPADDSWRRTAPLGTPRVAAEAVTLDDGRVLVVTGSDRFGPIATAELFDPTTERFAPTGVMSTPRSGLIATKLLDGRVLVAGGVDREILVNATAEVYDPATGRFTRTGDLVTRRYNHSATLLPSGLVLIAGGTTAWEELAGAEIYDPETGTFDPTGAMQFPRQSHSASLLPDGRVLIAGGAYRTGIVRQFLVEVGAAELYDPTTKRFLPAGGFEVSRLQFTAGLTDGTVVFMGGATEQGPLGTIEVYMTSTGPERKTDRGPGGFVTPPTFSAAGLALAVFEGGSLAGLEASARDAGARGAWLQDGAGTPQLLVVGGPSFLGDVLRATFPRGLSGPTAVRLTR